MQGLHLTADLIDCHCDAAWLLDAARGTARCLDAVRAAGLQAVAQVAHVFEPVAQQPSGYTATVLLAESHLCLHTWPEQRAVTLDVYVCNFSADHSTKAQALMNHLLAVFDAQAVERPTLQRGSLPVNATAAA